MPTAVRQRGARPVRREASPLLKGALFMAPAALILAAVIIFPLGYAIYTSFFRIRGRNMSFAGLDNYAAVLSDPSFWSAVVNSCMFTVLAVASHILLGLALALLLNRVTTLRTVVRLMILSPWVIAPSISAVIWMWLLEPQFGVLNYLLVAAGLSSGPVEWLGRPLTAFASIVMVDVWRGTPFIMVLILTALQAIPQSQYEAAQLDGAGSWQQFRFVTLPNIRYMLVIASTLDAIDALRQFDAINVMTGGGPVGATEVVPVLLYNEAFRANQLGIAAAMGVVFMVFIFVVTVFYVVMSTRLAEKQP